MSRGGSSTNIVVNSPETIAAVKYVTDLFKAGYIPESTVEWDSAGNNNTYLAGESAMVINLTTLYNAVLSDETSSYKGFARDAFHHVLQYDDF